MLADITRCMQLGDWIFEVKMVRALKATEYGQPYQAVSTLSIMGDSLYIDSQLARDTQELSREDCRVFYEFARKLDMKRIQYDKIRNGERVSRMVSITENQPAPTILKLAQAKRLWHGDHSLNREHSRSKYQKQAVKRLRNQG